MYPRILAFIIKPIFIEGVPRTCIKDTQFRPSDADTLLLFFSILAVFGCLVFRVFGDAAVVVEFDTTLQVF